ncbi:MAG: RNA polymerase sigma factor [Gemmatimonadetes bacterium]|jgi:RNA polymerase sigma-70 factor (ECF subfamily)|nr:RNA polymerase sigma factor [Gemmatimonadota bacterium]
MNTGTALAESRHDDPRGSSDEREDVRRATAGDMEAFERLYRTHVARIHGLTRRMLGEEWADELTQDVFVRAWTKLDTFRGDSAFGTWLHRVAVNLVLARRKELSRSHDRFIGDGEAVVQQATGRMDRPAIRLELEAAVTKLPDGARQVFVLHDVEGYRHREIAELLGVTTGTTKAQLHRARMILRQYVSR